MNNFEISGIGMTSLRTRERLIKRLKEEGIENEAVLEAIKSVPRHLFIDEALSHRAYEEIALPIGLGQTISQPYVVAEMTEVILKECEGPVNDVLEIGTGSGYQAAILSCVVKHVYSIERIGALLRKAKNIFAKLRIRNIHTLHGDGYAGWPNDKKFDAIIVTAAPEVVPQALLNQLKEGGVLVTPEGDEKMQELKLYRRKGDEFSSETIELVLFVPLVSGVV